MSFSFKEEAVSLDDIFHVPYYCANNSFVF